MLEAYAAEEVVIEKAEEIDAEWIKDPALRIRMTIYKAYLDDMTWVGNPRGTGYYEIYEGYHSWHAQNLWLQIAYYYGIPAGILLVILTGMLSIYHFKKMMKNKENPYAIIPFFLCVIYFVFGLMEVVWNTGQLILFLMFFVHMPLDNHHLLAEKSMESEKNN